MKQWVIKLALVGGCLFGLSACVSYVQLAEQRHVRQVCEQRCDTRLVQCQEHCHDSCQTCTQQAKAITEKYYQHYWQGRCVEGKRPILQLQSYHDPLQCRKKSCDCAADYRVCRSACRGSIPKRLQRQLNCCG